MLLVLGIEHSISHIRDVLARVRLSSNVNLLVLEIERLLKILEEAQETSCNSLLTRFGAFALGETGPNGLLYPDHVREIVP